MSNTLVFLVGLVVTLLFVIGMAITWFEFRKMDAAEQSPPAAPGRTPPL